MVAGLRLDLVRQELSSVHIIPVLVVACMSLSFCHLRCDRACFTAVRDQPGGRGGKLLK